jgi:electron transfer flavoprotein alpha subunit
MSESGEVWVFSEVYDLILEMLAKGKELADKLQTKLVAVLVGKDVQQKANELVDYGADKVYVFDNPALGSFQTEACLSALHSLAVNYRPAVLLIGSTRDGRPLAARLATRLNAGCVPDCFNLSIDGDGRMVCERIAYGGNAVATVKFKSTPQIATVPARAFEKPTSKKRTGQVVKIDAKVEPPKAEVVERKPFEASSVKVEEAQSLVCCGRGLGNKDDMTLLRGLAEVLGGQVGCSRPLVEDRKWFTEWIGLSGHKVKPKLYIACGISGVIQHVAGIRDSKVIVAINKDPEAPIFEVADYGVVGDLYEVLPALKEALRKQLQ